MQLVDGVSIFWNRTKFLEPSPQHGTSALEAMSMFGSLSDFIVAISSASLGLEASRQLIASAPARM
jgi:hypothetical protein